MFGLKSESIQAIQQVFSKYPQVDKVILYGSRAMEHQRSGSDIDLTLIGENIDLTLLQKIETELDDLFLPYKLDLSLFRQIQNIPLREHIKTAGKIFYQRT